MDFERLENETEEELIYRIGSLKDSIGNWQDVADILNDLLDKNYSESKYRKDFQTFDRMFKANISKLTNNDIYLNSIKEQTEQLKKERQKLNTINLEYNRTIRKQSRFELFYDTIRDIIPKFEPIEYKDLPIEKQDCEWLLGISDIHAGAEFDVGSNSYSFEECHRRFNVLRNYIINFIQEKKLNNIKILCLGDDIQGILRMTDLKINESTVPEAIVFVSRELSGLINSISTYCNVDYYHCPTANHSQNRPLNSKANELCTEDIEYVIGNYIKDSLSNNKRVNVHLNFGKEYIEFNIFDYNVIAMHGHQLRSVDEAIKNITFANRKLYDYLILGHFHSKMETSNMEDGDIDIETIVCPSFVGTCPYAKKIFKGAKSSCILLKFDKKYGHIDTKKIILN